MILLQSTVTVAYYALVAFATILLVHGFVRARSWDREILFLIVLIPFVLRLLRLK